MAEMYKVLDGLHESTLASVAQFLPWHHIIEDGIMFTKKGGFLASWSFTGPDMYSASDDEREYLAERVNEALQRRETGWSMFIDLYRVPSTHYPVNGWFPDRTTRIIDEERRAAYQEEGAHYESRYVLTLCYTEPSPKRAAVESWFLKGTGINEGNSSALKALAIFKAGIDDTVRSLRGHLSLNRLRVRNVQNEFGETYQVDDLLSFLKFCQSGVVQNVRPPESGLFVDRLLSQESMRGDDEPEIGGKHVVVVGVSNLPKQTYPGLLSQLDSFAIPFRVSTRAIMLSKREAMKMIGDREKNWAGKTSNFFSAIQERMAGPGSPVKIHRLSVEMEEDAKNAAHKVDRGDLRFLLYTMSVILFDDSYEAALKHGNQLVDYLRDLGFVAGIERQTAARAYFGSLPGETYSNVTRPPISTRNLAHLMPLTGIWPGIEEHRCPMYPKGSPALFFGKTTGSAPFRFSTHVDSVGHTFIIGPTGAGKSVFLGFCIAQFMRYRGAQGIIIDKGRSLFTLAKALELDGVARHYDVGIDSDIGFCPLAHIGESLQEQAYAVSFIETIISLAPGGEITIDRRKMIQEAIRILARPEVTDRSLGAFVPLVPDLALKNILDVFLTSPVGKLLDAESDGFDDRPLQFFETEGLKDIDKQYTIPIYMHIVHLAERKATKHPFLFVFDEAWAMFEDPYMQRVIRQLLKVSRKKNIACIFGTQSMEDITENPVLGGVLLQECLTKVFLPNHQAQKLLFASQYLEAGLSDHEIDILSELVRQRDYYYVSPLGRRPFSLELRPVTLAFVAVDSGEKLMRVRELIAAFPTDWPSHYLKEQGLADWAVYWDSLKPHDLEKAA